MTVGASRMSLRNITPNASSVRLVSSASVHSFRNPSIADLRASLAAHSMPVSSVPSSAGSEGEGLQHVVRRQSNRKPTPEQLALLGIQLDRSPSKRSPLPQDVRRYVLLLMSLVPRSAMLAAQPYPSRP
jgi:hypothetical protein